VDLNNASSPRHVVTPSRHHEGEGEDWQSARHHDKVHDITTSQHHDIKAFASRCNGDCVKQKRQDLGDYQDCQD